MGPLKIYKKIFKNLFKVLKIYRNFKKNFFAKKKFNLLITIQGMPIKAKQNGNHFKYLNLLSIYFDIESAEIT